MPPPNIPTETTLRRITRQIDETFQEVARLSGMNLPPTDFYQQFLEKAIAGIDATAGAVWVRTPQGFLQLQCQLQLEKIGLDVHRGARQHHNEMLRFAFQNRKELLIEPGGRIQIGEQQAIENKTEYVLILAPIKIDDKQTVGLLEICVEAAWDNRIHPTYLNYVVQMAGYASNYVMQTSARTSTNQEQVWTQLESFTRSIHSSLNPKEVAYQIANDGRKLVGCDRLSVAIRYGNKAKVEAVSGADVVEKASTHVRMMQKLFQAVIQWGEKLVYKGGRDETLPPDVLDALDDYLAESNPKLLVVEPLRDERERQEKTPNEPVQTPKPPRSALLLESYEPPAQVEPIISRLEVVGNHAASALYNAAEMKRVPFQWVWTPFVKLQDGLGGKTKFWIAVSSVLAVGLILAMILLPATLQLDADGNLLPQERSYIYPPRNGKIEEFEVNHADIVRPGQPLVEMFDPELQQQLEDLKKEINGLLKEQQTLQARKAAGNRFNPNARREIDSQLASVDTTLDARRSQLKRLEELVNGDPNRSGYFSVLAPEFDPNARRLGPAEWTVLSANYREELTGRQVTPTDPVLRLGNAKGAWEIELKIPQKHIGHVLQAFQTDNPREYLEVDILVISDSKHSYVGRLYRDHIGGEAVPNRTDQNESEPIVYAYVTVNEPEIPEEQRIPEDLLVAGVEVHTQIRCGVHALGYTLFYGLWEFAYRNVIFLF